MGTGRQPQCGVCNRPVEIFSIENDFDRNALASGIPLSLGTYTITAQCHEQKWTQRRRHGEPLPDVLFAPLDVDQERAAIAAAREISARSTRDDFGLVEIVDYDGNALTIQHVSREEAEHIFVNRSPS